MNNPFIQLAKQLLNGTRSAAWLHKQLREIRAIFIQICIFRKHVPGLNFDFSNEDILLQELAALIAKLKSEGVKIDLHPFHLLLFVCESWFWQIEAR
jgi:hypothetical protein